MNLKELTDLHCALQPYSRHTLRRIHFLTDKLMGVVGDRDIREISPAEIAGVLSPYAQRPAATFNVYLYTLRAIFETAVEMELLDRNPTKKIKSLSRSYPEVRAFTEEELTVFLSTPIKSYRKGYNMQDRACTRSAPYALYRARRDFLAFRLLAFTGLRISELVLLRCEDVDLDQCSLLVRKGKGMKRRWVPFPKELVPAIVSYQKIIPLIRQACDSEWFFCSLYRDGEHWTDRGFRVAFNRHLEHCGLDPTLHPHSLRHTYATMLLKRGVNIKHIQDLLGHASPAITMQIYLHPTQEDLRESASRLPYKELAKIPGGV